MLERPIREQLQGDEFLRHLERLAAEGMTDVLPLIEREAQRRQLDTKLMEARYDQGKCIACGIREQDSQATWCSVCWSIIEVECPPGQVVSGLARVLQMVTRKR